MRSLQVDCGRGWRGGQAQVLLLLRRLGERGVEALLVAPPGSPLAERARADGLRVRELGLRGEWDLASVVGLARLIRAEGSHVVHAHDARAVTLAGLAGRLARVPAIVAARRVDFPVSRGGRYKLRHLADAVVPVSEGVARVLEAAGLGRDRIEVIESGIDPAPCQAADGTSLRAELGGASRLIGTAGALVDHKDHRTLVEAMALLAPGHPGTHLLIAGEGPLAGELEALAAARGLAGRVRLLGFRPDLPAFLAALDVFVLSSHLEGLGTAVLEAMAAGRPVVATAAGGVPEMVEDGVTGLLVPPRDPTALAAAIARLLADPALARRLAEAGRARVLARFTADRTADRTVALYRRLLAGRGAA